MKEKYCYKCLSTEELMKKNDHLNICRPCRRTQQNEYTRKLRVVGAHKPKLSMELKEWAVFAKKKNSAIARKYA
jgi:hypothetical protein